MLRNPTSACSWLALAAFQVVPPVQCHTHGTSLLAVVRTSPPTNACLSPGTVAIEDKKIVFAVPPRFVGTSKVCLVHLLVAVDQLQAGGRAGRQAGKWSAKSVCNVQHAALGCPWRYLGRAAGTNASMTYTCWVLFAEAGASMQTYSKGVAPLPCSLKLKPSKSKASPVPTAWKPCS